MQVLALFKKYYTLFDVEVRSISNWRGYHEDRKCYTKVKKVAMNKEKAIKLCPNADFDENFVAEYARFSFPVDGTRVWDENDRFRFGKYFGIRIDECDDYNYMVWYWDHIADENRAHTDFVKKCLIKGGYTYKDMGGYGYFLSPEEVRRSKLIIDRNKVLIEKLENNEPINFAAERNLNRDGEYSYNNVTYKFNNFTSYCYDGYFYSLPLLNGKGKRIKYKNITITNYTYEINEDNIKIFIEDFKIK